MPLRMRVAGPGADVVAGAAGFAARVFTGRSLPTNSASPEALHAAMHGLYWLTANVATEHPLVLAVDERLAALTLEASATIHLPNLSERAVSHLVESRLGGNADPRIVNVCYAAAILDTDATVSRTAALAALSLLEAGVAADELVSAGLLTSARPFQFVHALMRGAVLASVPAAERSRLNVRAAQVLGEAGADVGIVARHLTECDPVGEPWVVDALQRAASKRWYTAIRAQTLRALLLDLLPAGAGGEIVGMLDTTRPELTTRDPDMAQRLEAETLSAARHSVSTSLWAVDRLRSWRDRPTLTAQAVASCWPILRPSVRSTAAALMKRLSSPRHRSRAGT